MNADETVYILGAGAIGLPLAAHLVSAGRQVIAVRTSRRDVPASEITVTVQNGSSQIRAPVQTVSLSALKHLEGIIVVTAKAHANQAIALELKSRAAARPVVLLQNGVGVERPFLETGFLGVYRCVLYVTSQAAQTPDEFTTRPISSSPVGVVHGDAANLERCVAHLNTDRFPFHVETNIQREVWKKAIINTVFNSVCPLLEADNGVFARDAETAGLARELVRECLTLTDRLGLALAETEIMAQIMKISQGSDGQLISTLQDIRAGRQTEIEFLNLEMARLAASMQPALHLPRVELLGKMIWLKSSQGAGAQA